jgi:hypothetical protein
MPKIYFEELLPRLDVPRPTPARYSLPEWWKKMDKFIGHDERMKRSYGRIGGMNKCPAVEESLFFGYTIYMPADLYIDSTGENIFFDHQDFLLGQDIEELRFAGSQMIEATKGYESAFNFHNQTLKWQAYWGVKTEEGYSCLFTHPFNRTDLPFYMVDAIVDTDKYTARFPYSFFIKKGFKGTIKRGTPIIQVFPFKREDEWQSEIVPVDKDNYAKQRTLMSAVFEHQYKKFFWTRKKFN